MQQLVVQPSVSEDGVCDEEGGMDFVAADSGETFGIDSRIECFFPCESSDVVASTVDGHSQCVFSILFTLARLECDLDCGDSWSDRKADVRCYRHRWTSLWLRRDIDLFPVEFVVVAVELRGIIVKVVHKMVRGDALRGLLIRTRQVAHSHT